jgi:Tfp pilus assembly protein PilO
MTLLRRILREKRALVLPVAIALAANALIYAAAVLPLTRSVDHAAARADAVAAALDEAKARQATAQATVDGKRRADDELKKFYKDVLPADWTAARRLAYTRLEQLARQFNLRPARTGSEPEADRESALAKLTVTMVVAGDYRDIREFIYELESSPEFVVIDNVALAQSEATNAPLVLTIEVSTYYRAKGDDD